MSSAVRAAAVQLCAAGRPALYKLSAGGSSPTAAGGLVQVPVGRQPGGGCAVRQIGEDAVFVLRDGGGDSVSFGVADGVGGWRDQGVDPGKASLALLAACSDALKSRPPTCLKTALGTAHRGLLGSQPGLVGSTTVCLARLTPATRRLEVANLGDSGLCVLDATTFAFKLRTRFQSNLGGVFNCPMQLAFPKAISNQYPRPEDCDLYSVTMEPGDIALVATDGLWDNLYQQTIEEIFRHAFRKVSSGPSSEDPAPPDEHPLEAAAKILVDAATYLSAQEKYFSPFCQSAKDAGLKYTGGKEDDISVVLARLCPDGELDGASGQGPIAKL